jgi:hypothetical protein
VITTTVTRPTASSTETATPSPTLVPIVLAVPTDAPPPTGAAVTVVPPLVEPSSQQSESKTTGGLPLAGLVGYALIGMGAVLIVVTAVTRLVRR